MAMFDVEGTQYDVFISYTTADNTLYGGWVDKFKAALQDTLGSHPNLSDLRKRRPEIFIDSESMPASGDMDQHLQEALTRSMFLVLMVTRNYFKSGWCFRELEYFRKRFGYKRKEAFDRTFIMVLEERALPDTRPWPEEQFGQELPRYIRFFDDSRKNGGPLSRYIDKDVPNEDYRYELMDIVERMGELYRSAAPQGSQGDESFGGDGDGDGGAGVTQPKALLGVVSEDLVAARDRLQGMLEAEGTEVIALTADDLGSSRRKALKARVDPSTVFVQLVSYAPVELDYSDERGHLILQRNILQHLGERAPGKTIWCFPEKEPDVVSEDLASATSPVVLDYVRAQLRDNPGYSTLEQVVAGLTGKSAAPVLRKVFVESSKADEGVGRELRDKLERVWKQKYKYEATPPPVFRAMQWNQRFQRKLPECRGVILLYGNKDEDSLEAQVDEIDKIVITLDHPPRKWVARTREHKDRGDVFWKTFSYHSEEDTGDGTAHHKGVKIEAVVRDIHDAITESKIGPSAVRAAPAITGSIGAGSQDNSVTEDE